MLNYRDPDRDRKKEIAKKSNAILRRLDERSSGAPGEEGSGGKLQLNSYEQTILTEVVAPEDIHVTFEGESLAYICTHIQNCEALTKRQKKDIGGLENIIDELRESVIYPLTA